MRVRRTNKNILVEEQSKENKESKEKAGKEQPGNTINLRNIIEVTEQNQPNPLPPFSQPQPQPHLQPQHQKQTSFSRYFRCISNLCSLIMSKSADLEIETKECNFAQIVEQIKNRKMDAIRLLPPQRVSQKVLVLDLDETLIHTTFNRPAKFDYESEVLFNGKNTKIYTVKRFGLDSFLFEMSKLFEIVVFTASQKLYADRIIDLIDPKRRISHRLYREHCITVNKTYFLKNLRSLGRNMRHLILVDDNSMGGLLQPENFIKIEPFEGSEKDRHLLRLSSFLKHIHQKGHFNSIKEELREYESLEIEVGSEEASVGEGLDLLEKKRRQYGHKKRNSEIQNLVTKSTEDEAEESAVEIKAAKL